MHTYTPTTDEVRRAYPSTADPNRDDFLSVLDSEYAEFERWLNEVKAAAWAEGALAGYDDCEFGREKMRNPYQTKED